VRALTAPIVVLTGADPTLGNRGMEALFYGAVELLGRQYAGSQIVDLEYRNKAAKQNARGALSRIEDSGTAALRVEMRFSRNPFHEGNVFTAIGAAMLLRVLPIAQLRRFLFRRLPLLALAERSQALFALNGGDSFSDTYGLRRLLLMIAPQILFLIAGRPVVQLPQTYGPFRGVTSRALARWVLNRSSPVLARDHFSLFTLTNILGNRPHKFVWDLAFLLPSRPPVAPYLPQVLDLARVRPVLGINVSGLLSRGGYISANQFGLTEPYPALVAKLIDFAVGHLGADVVLIPHVFGAQAESDQTACLEFFSKVSAKNTARVHYDPSSLSASEVKAVIGRCDLFVGSRMHACIAALSQGVPAVGLAYSDKFVGVFASLGLEQLVVDLRSAAAIAAMDTVARVFRERCRWGQAAAVATARARDALLSLSLERI
jgi:colanic acid/amylovoran biosynthesis protein